MGKTEAKNILNIIYDYIYFESENEIGLNLVFNFYIFTYCIIYVLLYYRIFSRYLKDNIIICYLSYLIRANRFT